MIFKKKEKGVILGKIRNRPFQYESLTEAQLNHHVHVVGASGFGKTVLLGHIIKDRIKRGQGILYIDLKGDSEGLNNLKSFIKDCDRLKDFKHFSLSPAAASSHFNILQSGSATQLRDTLMVSLRWSEEYYRNQASSYLLKVLIGLVHLRDALGEPLDVSILLKGVTDPEFLRRCIAKITNDFLKEKTLLEDCYRFLRDSSNFNSLQGLRCQLESLVLSDFGNKLNHSENNIDLFKAVHENQIVFITLDTRRYAESSIAIGKLILQDLKATSARIDAELSKEQKKPFTVIIDEFADLAQEDFIGFLDRARSSKIGIVMAHQELCDLLRISPEFAGRLMGNTSTMYAFLQKRPESAEIISKMAGTRTVWKKTLKTERSLFWDIPSGEKSLRETEEFNIHPNLVKTLRVGECITIKKFPTSKAHLLKVNF